MTMIYRSDEVKNSVKIEDVIQAYTGETLINNRMRCPFHSEKTASFFVHRKRQFFKCFGCGCGGDVITFVMNYFGTDFKTAVSKLCNDFGINTTAMSAENIIAQNEKIRKRKIFEKWEHDTFVLLCKAYHMGKDYLKEQNKGFFFDRLTDDYLYIINHIDLLELHIDLLIKNSVIYYNNYGEEGNIIAGRIIAGCGSSEDKPDDVRHSSDRGNLSYDYECRRPICG